VAVAGASLVLYHDVRTDAWYAPYVADVIEGGIAQGLPRRQWQTHGGVSGWTRPSPTPEVLKMAFEAAGKAPAAGSPQNASAQDTWAAGYVKAAEDQHVTVFQPMLDVNQPATRGAVIQTVAGGDGLPGCKEPQSGVRRRAVVRRLLPRHRVGRLLRPHLR